VEVCRGCLVEGALSNSREGADGLRGACLEYSRVETV